MMVASYILVLPDCRMRTSTLLKYQEVFVRSFFLQTFWTSKVFYCCV